MLRDYQKEMLDRLNEAWLGKRSVLVQMPTGTGKTVLLAETIRRQLTTGSKYGVLVVAHRMELIEQISQTLRRLGIDHGLIVSGKPLDRMKRVQVASIQTLSRRITTTSNSEIEGTANYTNLTNEEVFRPELVVVDEAHHALAKTYRMLWDRWPEARFLGLTATPCRLNGAAFTDLFDVLLQSWSIQTFIDRGWLSDFEYVSAAPDSEMLQRVASLGKRGADGDYQTKEMVTVLDCPESIAHLYQTYHQFANGKKGIVYAIDRQHARHIAAYYEEQGVSACIIDSRTPAEERRELVERYREGRLSVLVNVDIFSEGFDCPEVEFIQLARPTLSLSKYLQQVGRGMRIAQSKEAVLILDNVGLYQTFGLPTEERDWQEAFMGRLSGKGQQGMAHPVVVKDDMADEKMLVNLEMVRICKGSESLKGLAVCLQNGKYGVMKDGKVTCQPVFERIWRFEGDNRMFYALATYPYAFYRNRTTVIDLQGIDLMVQLYGSIEQRGDFLYGSDIKGDRLLWDAIGKKYYKDKEPVFESIGGLDALKSKNGMYELRCLRGMQSFLFYKDEVLYNNHIVIIRNLLIVKDEGVRTYPIFGFMKDNVLISTKKRDESIAVSWDGKMGKHYKYLPDGFSCVVWPGRLRLRKAE